MEHLSVKNATNKKEYKPDYQQNPANWHPTTQTDFRTTFLNGKDKPHERKQKQGNKTPFPEY